MNDETVFSVLTPIGRGAVAVVAVDGPNATETVDRFFRAANGRGLGRQVIGRIVYGHWGPEDLVACRRDKEHIEIHCHGGAQSVAAIARDLNTAGCVEVSWREWVARNERCPIRAAGRNALAEALSARAATVLLDQFRGALRDELRQIVSLLSDQELEARRRLESLLSTAELGRHLTQPWQVVIAGRTNVGKSSLINRLLGFERAIVFDQPGTTRDVVTATTVIDGWPVALSDTAGLHAATDELESAGIELARRRLAVADLMVWVLDAMHMEGLSVQEVVNRQIEDLSLTLPRRRLVVINKIDLRSPSKIPKPFIGTCALSGVGIDRLLTAIARELVPEVPPVGSAVLFAPEQVRPVAAALEAVQLGDSVGATKQLSPLVDTTRSESSTLSSQDSP